MSDMNNPSDENSGAMDDLWADALNEQKNTTSGKSAADAVFQQLGGGDVSGTLQDIDLIMDIPAPAPGPARPVPRRPQRRHAAHDYRAQARRSETRHRHAAGLSQPAGRYL